MSADEILGDDEQADFVSEKVPIHSLKLKDDSCTLMVNSLKKLFDYPEPIYDPNKFIKNVKLMKTLELDRTEPRKIPKNPAGPQLTYEISSYSSKDPFHIS